MEKSYCIGLSTVKAPAGTYINYMTLKFNNRPYFLKSVMWDINFMNNAAPFDTLNIFNQATQNFQLSLGPTVAGTKFENTFVSSIPADVIWTGDGFIAYNPGQYFFNGIKITMDVDFILSWINNDAAKTILMAFSLIVETDEIEVY
jgi:hypothetical protein